MEEDIGVLVFSQLLGMTQYPGSPFTGNLFKDLIMFLIVPTIFIILVIYTLSGRIVPAQVRLRALLSVGTYLFIIAGGYYPVFALLAGPYFIFLIFILGILFYFMGHFTVHKPRPAGPPGGPGEYPMGTEAHGTSEQGYIGERMSDLKSDLAIARENLNIARDKSSEKEAEFWAREVNRLSGQIRDLERQWKNANRYR